MSFDLNSNLNLESTRVIAIAASNDGLEVLSPLIAGFGVRDFSRFSNVEDAKRQLEGQEFHIIFVDYHVDSGDGYDLIRWIRRSAMHENRTAPVFFISSNFTSRALERARDAGASFAITKPVSPDVLLPRVLWVAGLDLTFVESEEFCGPDRRMRFEGPPAGTDGRRETDIHGELGEAASDNLDQDEIDAMLKTQRASAG
ncbi:response regulator [Hyphobacterium sp. HN65]|uniref:Response regulator n=1 Tax=Hyphobacterium lacteum TaxID=3116575 RepID=A0ABU7LQV2_9PROT|nr:response regulator [Hyphobacterium sp. HN65]MEE2526288.1 response regulator [Hyphobacterium sp. HN65]